MSLIKMAKPEEQRPITYDNPTAALIQRRRYQILVHSLIYYELDMNLVSDHQWAEWGKELVKLQEENPDVADKVIFADSFKGFDGSTGYNLPFRDEQIVRAAYRLLAQQPPSAEVENALYKLRYQVVQTPAEYDRYKKKSCKFVAISKDKPVNAEEVKHVEQKPRKGLLAGPRKRDS